MNTKVNAYFSLQEDEIRVQSLYTNTALRAGPKGCFSSSEAETTACCNAKENIKGRRIVDQSDPWNPSFYCTYADDGSGDWDVP